MMCTQIQKHYSFSLPLSLTPSALAPRSHFNTFPQASLTVLQLLTKCGWADLMATSSKHFGNMVLLYFYPLIFIGELIILNITTAVSSSKLNASNITTAVNSSKLKAPERLL